MTRQAIPYADGLFDDEDQQRFLRVALATAYMLPSPFALGFQELYELSAFQFWQSVETEALAHWLEQYPGTRPPAWWWWRAPEALRKRLGGTGVARTTGRVPTFPYSRETALTKRSPIMKAVTADLPHYGAVWRGLPVGEYQWQSQSHPGAPMVSTLDPSDWPVFESEAAFLERHKLLTRGEDDVLGDEPFKPVTLIFTFRPNGGIAHVATEPVAP